MIAGFGSAFVGAMDGFFVSMRDRFAPGERIFSKGFGDVLSTCAAYNALLERIRTGGNPLADFDPVFRTAPTRVVRQSPRQGGCTCRRATRANDAGSGARNAAMGLFEAELAYESPWSAHLPSEVRMARALWLSAARHAPAFHSTVADDGATTGLHAAAAATADTDSAATAAAAAATPTSTASEPSAIVLHMPAFGEEGYGSRKDCARALALEDNAINLILMAPFYGARRREGQRSYSPLTVADMICQSFAISIEAAALIRWAAARWPRARLLVTGFSYGGAMTGTGGTYAAACLPPADRARLGIVPCIGSPSPVVLLEGVLRNSVDWEGLARPQPAKPATTAADAEPADSAVGKSSSLAASIAPAAAAVVSASAASASAAMSAPVPPSVMSASDRAELARLLQAPAIATAPDVPSLLHAVLAGVRLGLLLDVVLEGSATAAAAAAVAARRPAVDTPAAAGLTGVESSASTPAAVSPSASPAAVTPTGARSPRHLFGAVSSIAAAHDEFVRPRFTLEQHECLATAVPGPHAATIVTVGGGHVAAFVRRRALFVPAVRRALAVLSSGEGSASATPA